MEPGAGCSAGAGCRNNAAPHIMLALNLNCQFLTLIDHFGRPGPATNLHTRPAIALGLILIAIVSRNQWTIVNRGLRVQHDHIDQGGH